MRILHGIAASVVIASCTVPPDNTTDSDQRPTAPANKTDSGQRASVSPAIDRTIERPAEQPILELAQKIDGLAGWYCENGDLVVGMAGPVQPARDDEAIRLIEAMDVASACHNRAFPKHEPKVVIARKTYSFLQLRAWRDAIWDDYFSTDGATGLGLNYTNNLIRMKVEPGKRGSIEALAALYKIPSDAFTIIDTKRATPQTACPNPSNGPYLYGNCFRPIPGGVEHSPTGGGECTITAATDRYLSDLGYWQSGLVTAGHCLHETGSLTGKYLYQHDSNDASQFVGSEYVDPPFWQCHWYSSNRCRYSDSTWVFAGNAAVQHGTIAQTLFPQQGAPGSLYVSATHPRFYVYGSRGAVEGMQVEKVGRSSGWTTGLVTDTCSDESTNESFADGNTHIYLCQGLADLHLEPGDSGSPVFYWWWFYDVDTVELIGLLWGAGDTAEDAVYSPWSNVENDIGPNLYIQYPYF